ncbi:MAG: hypothetical protein WC876_05950 [Candidatus Thermoplasmatota archaeon]|jgi:hypothetical protein
MNEPTTRGLLAAGLSTNVLFLALALIDYASFDSRYMWPIFVGWAVLIVLLVVLALSTSAWRVQTQDGAAPALARAVASLASRPGTPQSTIVHTHTPPTIVLPSRPASKALDFSAEPTGPFTYNGYTLYSRGVDLKNGGQRTIWFFSKRIPSSGHPARKPSGFHVGVNERTGLPFLKKGAGKDGEDLTPRIEAALRPQCSALTNDGAQCRNSSREASKYCASHFGYQPPTAKGLAKRIEGDAWKARDRVSDKSSVKGADTRPAVRSAPDTKVAVRRKSTA